MNNNIITYTGKIIDIFNFKEENIDIVDIAASLSKQCRFGGHCREFYSVAQHSANVVKLVDPKYKLHALLHDASEAYLVDVPRPVKNSEQFTFYRELENNIMNIIYKKFNIEISNEEIKQADDSMLVLEQYELMVNHKDMKDFNEEKVLKELTIFPLWAPKESQERFLNL